MHMVSLLSPVWRCVYQQQLHNHGRTKSTFACCLHSQPEVSKKAKKTMSWTIAVTSTIDYLKNDDLNRNLPSTCAALPAETNNFSTPTTWYWYQSSKRFQLSVQYRQDRFFFFGKTSRKQVIVIEVRTCSPQFEPAWSDLGGVHQTGCILKYQSLNNKLVITT